MCLEQVISNAFKIVLGSIIGIIGAIIAFVCVIAIGFGLFMLMRLISG